MLFNGEYASCVAVNATKGLLFVSMRVRGGARTCVCFHVLSSAELPKLCGYFAQLCFNLQQLL